MLTVGSLFSGIGGFDLGLERAGMRVAWQCEADEFCRRVLAKHWPRVPCYEDVRELAGANVSPVDVLCGGFPCQDISLAGKGAGIDGARSGLWSEYARLVGELRPSYVVVENVAALLARGMGRVLGDLASFGYNAEWDCIPASAVGAPHQRDRVWLVAYPRGEQHEGSGLEDERPASTRLLEGTSDPSGNGWRSRRAGRSAASSEGQREPDETVPESYERRTIDNADRGRHRIPKGQVCARRDGAIDPGWWTVEPPVGRVAHGVPDRLDQLAALGNALVPQIAEWIGRRIIEWEARAA